MIKVAGLFAAMAAAFGSKVIGGGSSRPPRRLGPAVAGTWYPSSAGELARTVDGMLSATAPQEGAMARSVVALIAPHAGFVYSGEVAGRGFRLLAGGRYSRIVLIGPSHYAGFRGAVVPDATSMGTPLGEVPIDDAALDLVRDRPGFHVDNDPFVREHCLEAEIPFLQRVLEPGWRVVPVLVGSGVAGRGAQELADGLAPLIGPDTLVVVSSDFTHFGRGFGYAPFREDVEDRIRDLDLGAVRLIEARDAKGFEDYVDRTGATICGRSAIGVLLRALPPGEVEASLVAYDTSGRMTGDFSHTVSYASVVFRRLAPARAGTNEPRRRADLTPPEKRTLLALAQASIRDALLGDGSLARALETADLTPRLHEVGAAFVTLKEPPPGKPDAEPELRGCIGTIFAHEPLHQSVVHNAVQAALHDPRFPPLRAHELESVALSLSVLSPIRPIAAPESIVPGRDGVVLAKGPFGSVFLPQVAAEQGWGTRELLEHLALKAGLPRDGWKGADLSVFEAEVFGAGEGADGGDGC